VRPRFHLPTLDPETGGTLTGDEATHLTRVLRLGVGAEVDVFDGRGGMFQARVTATTRDTAAVAIVAPAVAAPEARLQITLAMAVLKGDKMDDVVRDAAMMGVAAIQPLVTARAEVALGALVRGHRAARWQRIAVSAAKQCGRAVVPPVAEPLTLTHWLTTRPAPLLALCEPSAAGEATALGRLAAQPAVTLLVGPEGGWTPAEVAAIAAAPASLVRLGPRTLRADAAPLVALAALFEAWQGW
jgi:16S rRNA (uracil1498-N3)-methyltransferase